MKIYVVMGTTGEYSDRDEWAVKAFNDIGKAKGHVVFASRKAAEVISIIKDDEELFNYQDIHCGWVDKEMVKRIIDLVNVFDDAEKFKVYDDEVNYFYYEVDLAE